MVRRKDDKGRVLKEGESQRKDDGIYMFRWSQDGKRHAIYSKSLSVLREKEKNVKMAMMDGIKADERNRTLNTMYYKWKVTKAALRRSTKGNYFYMYEHYVKNDFGEKRLTAIKKSDIKCFYNSLIDDKGLALGTVDSINTVLHQVFQLAVDDDYIRKNVTDGVLSSCKTERHYVRPKKSALSEREQLTFIGFLQNSTRYRYWYPFFAVAFGTGCRVGEIIGLRWENVNLEDGIINIEQTLSYFDRLENKAEPYVGAPKTNAGKRVLPIGDVLKKALEEQKNWMELMRRECAKGVGGYTDYVFLNKLGHTYTPQSLNRMIKKLVKLCNVYEAQKAAEDGREPVIVPEFTNHIMRHSFCTRYVENESNLSYVQEYMGQADIRTTMGYVDVKEDKLRMSIENIQNKMISA